MERVTRRYLRPLKSVRTKRFYVFDSETGTIDDDGKITYKLSARPEHYVFGVIYGPEGYKVLYTVEDARKEFRKKKYRSALIFAHNAEYDFTCVYGNIYKEDPEAIFNGKLICFTNGVATFADSFNILPTSVKKLGELLGLSKKELGNNLISHVDRLHKDIDYCVRDCEIVYRSLINSFTETGTCLTIGGVSLKDFRLNYLKNTIKIDTLSDLFFDCFYGGRTEAIFIGKCNGRVIDINSAYPYVMDRGRYPNPGALIQDTWTPEQYYEYSNMYEGMATCVVRVPDMNIPPLPYRTKTKLLFPTGVFKGSWTFPELSNAVALGVRIISPCEVIYSKPIDSPFHDFITDNYNKRLATTNEFEKLRLKLKMNNLYGKLVQKEKQKFVYVEDPANIRATMDDYGVDFCEVMNLQDGCFLKFDVEEEFTNHTIACWGAYITARVRIMLTNSMINIEKSGGNVLYCDTDSISFTINKPGPVKIDIGDALGQWKVEDKIITSIRGPKDYNYTSAGKDYYKLKGIKQDALEIATGIYSFKRMIKTRESLVRKDEVPGTFKEQIKFVTGRYTKRVVLTDGTTKPIKFKQYD